MAQNKKILHYIDLPLQHCSNKILSAMNRKGTKEDIISVISKLRAKMPDVVIRTTFITGFPGETEEDFQDSLRAVTASAGLPMHSNVAERSE